MLNPSEEVVLAWMMARLVFDHAEYIDECGEPRYTTLAEHAADVHDLYEDDPSATIPEWVFEASIGAFERSQVL